MEDKRIITAVIILFCWIGASSAQDSLYIKRSGMFDHPTAISLNDIDSIVFHSKYCYIYNNKEGRKGYRYEAILGTDLAGRFSFTNPETISPYTYHVAKMTIDLADSSLVTGKTKADYKECAITIDSDNDDWDFSGRGKIRGRGNSSWLWYDKKPYRIKLYKKSNILGLKMEKDWVLLANYRDPTDMMNTFVFIMGQGMGLPYTNNSRYVEVTMGGEYIGLYQLTEQVEVGSSRVNIDEDEGILLAVDVDDGPGESPDAADNFWSEVFRVPCCVKNPKDPTPEIVDSVRKEFAKLEEAINEHDYDTLSRLMDIGSYIDYLLIQEFVYNVELAAPRSVYLFKDKEKRWAFGPLWDFDGGYDFDWDDMYSGHQYFDDYTKTVIGTNPYRHTSTYSYTSSLFTNMWSDARFVADVRSHWNIMKQRIVPEFWAETMRYYNAASDALQRDYQRWPLTGWWGQAWQPGDEILRMEQWITDRVTFMDSVVAGYPDY